MARKGITYDDVVKICLALNKMGINPTIDNVRDAHGSGSKTTIMKHLQRYHAESSLTVTQNKKLSKHVIEIAIKVQNEIDGYINSHVGVIKYENRLLKEQIKELKAEVMRLRKK